MHLSIIRTVVFTALVAACAPFAAGCYVEAEAEPTMVVPRSEYEVQYYDGYVVYYDNVGRPYYYVNGGATYVPRSYVGYYGLTNHYTTYSRGYNRWYTRGGYRYKTYRTAPARRTYRR